MSDSNPLSTQHTYTENKWMLRWPFVIYFALIQKIPFYIDAWGWINIFIGYNSSEYWSIYFRGDGARLQIVGKLLATWQTLTTSWLESSFKAILCSKSSTSPSPRTEYWKILINRVEYMVISGWPLVYSTVAICIELTLNYLTTQCITTLLHSRFLYHSSSPTTISPYNVLLLLE